MLSCNPGLWFRCVMHWPCPPVSTYTWPRPPGQRFRGGFSVRLCFGIWVCVSALLRPRFHSFSGKLLHCAPTEAWNQTRAYSVDLLSAYYENEDLSFDNNTAGVAFAVQLTR